MSDTASDFPIKRLIERGTGRISCSHPGGRAAGFAWPERAVIACAE